MMRYIDHILQPGETVAYTTTLHWVVYLPAIALWLLAFIALTVGGALGPVSLLVALVCALVGLGVAASLVSALDNGNRRDRQAYRLQAGLYPTAHS
jgi:phosphate/sulfate permease